VAFLLDGWARLAGANRMTNRCKPPVQARLCTAPQGLGKTVTCMALILKTLGTAAGTPEGAEVVSGPDSRGRPCGYYLLHESGKFSVQHYCCLLRRIVEICQAKMGAYFLCVD